jgi:two-component system, sporulation sensor kinase E
MKAGFLDKLIERIDRLDPRSVQTHFLRLAKEKGLLETIFQSIQEGVIVVDGKARVNYANRAAEKMLGFTQETIQGRPVTRYIREIDWERILDLDAGEWSKLISREIEVRYPEPRFLNFYVVPLSAADSGERGAVIILRDVTHDRAQEASLLESERMNALRLLAAGVAHEIGNPLNALNIHLQLLSREMRRLDPEQRKPLRELLDVATKEAARLDVIITQFLRAIRPAKPALAPNDVADILRETLALLKHELQNRRVHVELDCQAPLPRIKIDRDQIKQAFFNIVRNALQAMSDGGLLRVTVSSTDRFVAVAFRDTGAGIPPEDFGHIFEPYFTTKTNGTGLGLMIVQRIVQDHGGRIDVHSEPGVGTTFTVFLPLDERRVRLLRPHSREARPALAEDPA